MRRFASTIGLLVAAVATSACASSADRNIGQSQSAVINGVVDDMPAKYESAFLIMTQLDAMYAAGCTGTLISPHVMITARHCVSNYNESTRTFGADFDTANMLIWYGPHPAGSEDLHVAKIVHPAKTNTIVDNDFALLVLTKPSTRPFAPIRLAKPPTVGESVAVAGYGVTTTDTGKETTLHARYRRDGLAIKAIGPSSKYYDLGNNEIVLGEATCHGDSGGPVYDTATGALLAVTSRGGNGTMESATNPSATCVNRSSYPVQNYFSRVDAYAALIKETVASVGEEVWEEGTPKPTPPTTTMPDPGALGSACTASNDCASKICAAVDTKTVCSQRCSDTKLCPSGFDCVSGYCFAHVDPGTVPGDPGTPADDPNAATDDGGTVKKGGCSTSGGGGDPIAALLLAGAGFLLSRRKKDHS